MPQKQMKKKNICERGILCWKAKVKNLKPCVSQLDVQLLLLGYQYWDYFHYHMTKLSQLDFMIFSDSNYRIRRVLRGKSVQFPSSSIPMFRKEKWEPQNTIKQSVNY